MRLYIFLFFTKTGPWQLWIYEGTKYAEEILKYTSTSTLLILETKNFNNFIRFAILLTGDNQVIPGPDSNLCDSCGKRVNKRCLCCIKYNVRTQKTL